jgi:hypothetical protein
LGGPPAFDIKSATIIVVYALFEEEIGTRNPVMHAGTIQSTLRCKQIITAVTVAGRAARKARKRMAEKKITSTRKHTKRFTHRSDQPYGEERK